MISNYLRVIRYKDSTYTDLTLESQKADDNFNVVLGASEYIYLGQYLPFNSSFVQVNTGNQNSVKINIDLWDGSQWISAVDIIDGTAALNKSGVIQWTLNKNYAWMRVDDTSLYSALGLTDYNIYNLHWARLSYSSAPSTDTSIKRIRYKFTEDVQLQTLDPEIDSIRAAWDASKTDWLDQILTASEMVALDLKSRGLIKKHNQIFRFDELYVPTAYKTLSIIYAALGDEYQDKRDHSNEKYNQYINQNLTVDKNEDGHITISEKVSNSGGLYR